MINSMTGYGGSQDQLDGVTYIAEIRTLNNRYFKTKIRLPEPAAFLEKDIEKLLRENLLLYRIAPNIKPISGLRVVTITPPFPARPDVSPRINIVLYPVRAIDDRIIILMSAGFLMIRPSPWYSLSFLILIRWMAR